jgi:hypothetical protein
LQLGFGRVVTTIACRHISKCRNVDCNSDEPTPNFFIVLKNCALHPDSRAAPVKAPIIQFASLGKRGSKDTEFQKGYLKPIDEEPTGVMPNAMEKFVSELPRITEIVALFQNINEAGPLTGARVERSA